MKEYIPYNPLDKVNLGVSVADALLAQDVLPLGNMESFIGAGIYSLYYVGEFHAYESLVLKNKGGRFGLPIYVGKAVPQGARKGLYGLDGEPGTELSKRLNEHAKSIEQVSNLDIKDFYVRFLVVEDIWIPLGESLLIKSFSPLWNLVVDGFGNHDPGKGRYNQQKSAWDVIHPGRSWAEKCAANSKNPEQVINEIKVHFSRPSRGQ